MGEKLNQQALAQALAISAAILYIICAVLFMVASQGTMQFFMHLFHGVDVTKIARDSIPFSSTIIGFVEWVILAYVSGWLFAWVYNSLVSKAK